MQSIYVDGTCNSSLCYYQGNYGDIMHKLKRPIRLSKRRVIEPFTKKVSLLLIGYVVIGWIVWAIEGGMQCN